MVTPVPTPALVLGIDASNIRRGGGLTHLVELLRAADPVRLGFSSIVVWSRNDTLEAIEDRPWLEKVSHPWLSADLVRRVMWHLAVLPRELRRRRCDVLYAPGGLFLGGFRPVVACSQNLLPFELRELARYGWSFMSARLLVLRVLQALTFRRARTVICLTDYARNAVARASGVDPSRIAVVPHGVSKRFIAVQKNASASVKPLRLLYVSIIDVYKHQWTVARAVAKVRQEGYEVEVSFVGPAYAPALRRLSRTLDEVDPGRVFARYLGEIDHEDLAAEYQRADAFVFASSCESYALIVPEAIMSGLPMACARQGSLVEILGDTVLYFNPESVDDTADALRELVADAEGRAIRAERARLRLAGRTWKTCADATLAILARAGR